ncbi:hypothetical protein ABB37_01202 [Leptomonas pyrrhocoris]|uniref:Uncharacterized protein n=1 Tax=Leptomonas pyrrhocoris TaxID=157538 RepID=A0A0M9G8B3_LEPPY|nr:hypothetical protein ABB37_01202 [Leptomonas pyrrhocoris]KPA84697.1 hypothetical protein ABB37_01202 [Leptomonas pyrrhocoris]|eukprot:XP_015663136.1 hypothetical protein ABB37_01202 [Leptomonas pyrrhocoris]
MTVFGLYQEDASDESIVEADRIAHMVPLLEGPHGEEAEDAIENTSVLDVVNSLRQGGDNPESVEVRTIRWRGQTEASIRSQLQPIVLHYRLQILLVQERTQRRALMMRETNERVPLVTAYYKETPVKWRLLGYMDHTTSASAMLMAADSESVYRTPASTIASVSEVKREQQFRESFMRMEETALRHGGGSSAATPMRLCDDGRRSPSARNSGYMPAASRLPLRPKGAPPAADEEYEVDAAKANVEVLDSTVAFVDRPKRQ